MPTKLYRHFFSRLSTLPLCVLLGIAPALAEQPAALLQQLNTYPPRRDRGVFRNPDGGLRDWPGANRESQW